MNYPSAGTLAGAPFLGAWGVSRNWLPVKSPRPDFPVIEYAALSVGRVDLRLSVRAGPVCDATFGRYDLWSDIWLIFGHL